MAWRAPYADPRDWDYDEGINLMKVLLVDRGYALYTDIWSDQPPLLTAMLSWWFKPFGSQRGIGPRADPALLSADPVEPLSGYTKIGLRVCRRCCHAAAGAQRILHPPQRRGDGRSAGPGAGLAGRSHPGDGSTSVVAHRALRHDHGAGLADQALCRRHGTGCRRLSALRQPRRRGTAGLGQAADADCRSGAA